MKKLMKFTMSLPDADACFYFSVLIQKELFVGCSIIKRVQSNRIDRQTRLFSSFKAIQQECKGNPRVGKNFIINPWWVTGFTDAEGCFSLSVIRNKKSRLGWLVKPIFKIGLHQKDKSLLEQIQSFFSGSPGSISKQGPESLEFRVESVKDLAVIINHFDSYPLITQKWSDYQLFKQTFELIKRKEHLTEEGLRQIVAIKASMNLGISEKLKSAFPPEDRRESLPVARPIVKDQFIKDPGWLAGFTSGEGCFRIRARNSSSYRLGFRVELVFTLTQHSREDQLMKSLFSYLDCGTVHKYKETFTFQVTKFSDIHDKIIPFFAEYPVLGVKAKDFEDWCQTAEMMKEGKHLTKEGLEEISKIKAGMNRERKF